MSEGTLNGEVKAAEGAVAVGGVSAEELATNAPKVEALAKSTRGGETTRGVYNGCIAGQKYATIAQGLGVSQQTVQYHVKKMWGKGIVLPKRRGGSQLGARYKKRAKKTATTTVVARPAKTTKLQKSAPSVNGFSSDDLNRGFEFIRHCGSAPRASQLIDRILASVTGK